MCEKPTTAVSNGGHKSGKNVPEKPSAEEHPTSRLTKSNKDAQNHLDKDWGAHIPQYITDGCISFLVFVMAITMRGDWLMFLAHYWRSQEGEVEVEEKEMGEWGVFLSKRFENFWPTNLVVATSVSYLFFFGIGGFLHFYYYVGKKDKPEEWKCQPNNWLSRKDEIHEIAVGFFSLNIGSAMSALIATWVMNGGYTALYYEWGQYGVIWGILELPIVYVVTDYMVYWFHRLYHLPFMYKYFHKLHHTYKQPTAFSVTALHPFEFVNIQAVYVVPMFFLPMHAAVYCSFLIYIYYHGIIDHSGINFKRYWFQPWQPDCIFHDNHHQYFHVNFGLNMEIWDKIHGTERKKDKIYREDIFYGKGKDISEATKEELEADIGERRDENPLAHGQNKNKYL